MSRYSCRVRVFVCDSSSLTCMLKHTHARTHTQTHTHTRTDTRQLGALGNDGANLRHHSFLHGPQVTVGGVEGKKEGRGRRRRFFFFFSLLSLLSTSSSPPRAASVVSSTRACWRGTRPVRMEYLWRTRASPSMCVVVLLWLCVVVLLWLCVVVLLWLCVVL